MNDIEWYIIDGDQVALIKRVMKRLYSETRFKDGDEMRDNAQLLQVVIDKMSKVPDYWRP